MTGRFGIREPARDCPEIPFCTLDLVLVPGVAFDLSGRGWGAARDFTTGCWPEVRGIKCGVAFEEQIVHGIPVEPLDVRWILF